MDVDKIQKINKLAGDLISSGMAKDRDEAVSMAEKQIKNESFGDIKQQMDDTDAKNQNNIEKQNVSNNEPIKEEIKEESEIKNFSQEENKLIYELKKDVEEHKKKVGFLIEKMNQMILKINELEKKVKSPVAIQQSSGNEKKDDGKQTAFKKEAVTNNPNETKPANRYGEYQPNDVAIDKIFYYGNKPQK